MEYHMTETVPEILRILGQADGRAMILAGGTDLMIDLEEEIMKTIKSDPELKVRLKEILTRAKELMLHD